MCGIVGIFNFNRQPVAHSQIKAMTDIISHRGPDGEGQYIDGSIALGHRRLSIIDLSPAGHQPMQTRDGRFIITYNGEVYNFKELRIELEALGYQFHSATDTEVILYSYVEWGYQCLTKFNGMFAFAIWDKKNQELFLGRDRYGIKPIYYCKRNDTFIFASEIKAIISSGLYQSKIDKEGLVEYLTFQNFFTDRTLFEDIKMLMPGHYAYITLEGNLDKHEYWDFNFCGSLKISKQEAIEETDRLFRQAVQRQLVSDVPINAYLSGGIDSGAITMVASKFIPHMKTFTIGFDLSSASGLELSCDERDKAEYISYLAKTEHYEMVLKAGDMERCMDRYVFHLEEPRVGQSYPNYYAAKLASKFGKVLLSGIGGDELFAGYTWRYFYSDTPKRFNEFSDEYYQKWQRLVPNRTLKELLKNTFDGNNYELTKGIFLEILNKTKTHVEAKKDFINESLYLEAKTFLHGLLVVEDKLSMAHSLEVRVPYLDNDLVNFSMQLPSKYKVNLNKINKNISENEVNQKNIQRLKSGKIVLRKTLERYLPRKISNAKKQGFSAPDSSWFKGDSIKYVENILMSKESKIYKYINFDKSKDLINKHFSGEKNMRLFIWSLLCVDALLNEFEFDSIKK